MKTYILDETAKQQIRQRLKGLSSPYEAFDRVLLQIHRIFADLPELLLEAILAFGRHPDIEGAMLLKNMPTDEDLCDTPPNGERVKDKKTFVSEGCALGITQLIGEPVGYLSEKSGEIIHNVVPVQSGCYTQSNQGSKVFLNFHNDIVYDDCGSYHEKNPDFLVLYCLRDDPTGQAFTYFCDARDLCRLLDKDDLEILRRPLFRTAAPSSYTREAQKGKVVWSKPMPILKGPMEYPEICVSANGLQAMMPEAETSFNHLRQLCMDNRICQKVLLQPGDALLINNRKGLHARNMFEPAFNGKDRWLQRTYVRRDLWDLRERWTGTYRVY